MLQGRCRSWLRASLRSLAACCLNYELCVGWWLVSERLPVSSTLVYMGMQGVGVLNLTRYVGWMELWVGHKQGQQLHRSCTLSLPQKAGHST
jgi:hypothetical protein